MKNANKKLRERDKISVAHVARVESAVIDYVVRTRFIRRIHYIIAGDRGVRGYGTVPLDAEGTQWVRGWTGPEVEALAVSVALK